MKMPSHKITSRGDQRGTGCTQGNRKQLDMSDEEDPGRALGRETSRREAKAWLQALRFLQRSLVKASPDTCLDPQIQHPQHSSWAEITARPLAPRRWCLGSECPACPPTELPVS